MSEPLKTRREKEKQARYDSILDAAELVFSEKGYERTSMDDIARTAALSRALLGWLRYPPWEWPITTSTASSRITSPH